MYSFSSASKAAVYSFSHAERSSLTLAMLDCEPGVSGLGAPLQQRFRSQIRNQLFCDFEALLANLALELGRQP